MHLSAQPKKSTKPSISSTFVTTFRPGLCPLRLKSISGETMQLIIIIIVQQSSRVKHNIATLFRCLFVAFLCVSKEVSSLSDFGSRGTGLQQQRGSAIFFAKRGKNFKERQVYNLFFFELQCCIAILYVSFVRIHLHWFHSQANTLSSLKLRFIA